ncbi:hypothetical protein [Actinomadura fibrosa]|uniref:FAD-binding domain-containing protein n=1 Tax=Actinomadura fibrosa TaxID=111802 RepID=A0ABW2Y676_9ACTN
MALLGDAAHPMLPFFAQGAGQTMEDAAALVMGIEEAGDLAKALAAYERARAPRTIRVQEASHDRATGNHFVDGPERQARDLPFASQAPRSTWLSQLRTHRSRPRGPARVTLVQHQLVQDQKPGPPGLPARGVRGVRSTGRPRAGRADERDRTNVRRLRWS